jgi:hypothetical protein
MRRLRAAARLALAKPLARAAGEERPRLAPLARTSANGARSPLARVGTTAPPWARGYTNKAQGRCGTFWCLLRPAPRRGVTTRDTAHLPFCTYNCSKRKPSKPKRNHWAGRSGCTQVSLSTRRRQDERSRLPDRAPDPPGPRSRGHRLSPRPALANPTCPLPDTQSGESV